MKTLEEMTAEELGLVSWSPPRSKPLIKRENDHMREDGIVEASMAKMIQNLLGEKRSRRSEAPRLKEVPETYTVDSDGFSFHFMQTDVDKVYGRVRCRFKLSEGVTLSILDHDPRDQTPWAEKGFEVAVLDANWNLTGDPENLSGADIVAKVREYIMP